MTRHRVSADPFATRHHGHRGRVIAWEGHELVELESPDLKLSVSLSRGAEIVELRVKALDLDVLWHGHPDIVRNRGGQPTLSLDRGNFLDDFGGGWQEILSSAQFPVEYRGARLGQHGEAALLPWNWRLITDTPEQLAVSFSVELRRTPLRLTRLMTLRDGELKLEETVENRGSTPVDVQWGHHIALAGPVIAPGSTVHFPSGTAMSIPPDASPTNRLSAGEFTWPQGLDRNGQPVALDRVPDDDGQEGTIVLGPMDFGHAEIRSSGRPLSLQLSWDAQVYRYCWMWIVLGGCPDWPMWGQHRLVTIEPISSPLVPLTDAIKTGDALTIAPGASASSWLALQARRPKGDMTA